MLEYWNDEMMDWWNNGFDWFYWFN